MLCLNNDTRAFSGEHSHPWNALCTGYFGHWSLHDVHHHSTTTLIDNGRIWLTRKHNDRHGSLARPHYAVCERTLGYCNAGNHADELTRLASSEQHPQPEQEEKGLAWSHYYAFGYVKEFGVGILRTFTQFKKSRLGTNIKRDFPDQ